METPRTWVGSLESTSIPVDVTFILQSLDAVLLWSRLPSAISGSSFTHLGDRQHGKIPDLREAVE